MKKIAYIYKNIFCQKHFRRYLFFSVFLFLLFFVLGIVFSVQSSEASIALFEAISRKYSFAGDYGFFRLFLFIFNNNLIIAFLAILGGFIFGLPTFFILASNGFFIGLVFGVAAGEINLGLIILSLLPHGIFEIPAILFSLSAGFLLGQALFEFAFKKKEFRSKFIFSGRVFVFLVFPLLFLAAFIESLLIVLLK